MNDYFASYQYLTFDRPSDRVLRITINRPEKLNSLPWEAHGELTRVWLDVDRDPDTNVAIIRGAGKAFCAGGDFGMVEKLTRTTTGRPKRCGNSGSSATTSSTAPSPWSPRSTDPRWAPGSPPH